jgi:dCMP deaminase
MTRPTWDETWLGVAAEVAKRAACTRSQVGAVLTADNKLTYLGYNGVPAGEVHCTDGGCPRGLLTYEQLATLTDYSNCPAFHAEYNAILKAGQKAKGGTIYVTREPCSDCYRHLMGAGVVRAVWPKGEKLL